MLAIDGARCSKSIDSIMKIFLMIKIYSSLSQISLKNMGGMKIIDFVFCLKISINSSLSSLFSVLWPKKSHLLLQMKHRYFFLSILLNLSDV